MDLPRNTPLDSVVESLGMKKGENVNLGNVRTKIELYTGTNPTRCVVMMFLSALKGSKNEKEIK